VNNPSQLVSAVSYHQNPVVAAEELASQLCRPGIGFVLFFCSAEYPLVELGQALKLAFVDLPLVGCTTAGEITPQGYGQGCITAIGFDKDVFAVEAALIDRLQDFKLIDAQSTVEQLMAGCRDRDIAPITGNTFALTLLDGLSVQEEQVLVTLNAALGSIPHFGGSAADELHLTDTHVYFDGRFHTDAAVLLLFNTRCEFKVFSTHHMVPTDDKLVVTAASCEERQVKEFNAEPAAISYAQAVGVPLEQLDHTVFALNPIAVRLGDEHYVRSIQKVNDDLSLTFYGAVETGIVLTVMKAEDIVADTQTLLEGIERELGEPQAVIGCDCFLRRMELELTDRTEMISDLLRRFRVLGFNTYGEQFAGMHINQTFTGVAIGRCRDE